MERMDHGSTSKVTAEKWEMEPGAPMAYIQGHNNCEN